MIEIDCSEMDLDEQLALASAVSDGLAGRGVAMVKDAKLEIDEFAKIEPADVAGIVRSFVSKRKDAQLYSVAVQDGRILVHTPDPLARARGKKDPGQILPPNLLKCPFCSFITPYQELYNVHMRSHLFGV